MKPLNVLLVVYAFPPATGVGTLRAASLARYLPAENIRLDVLTTKNPATKTFDSSYLAEFPPEVTVHRTMTVDLPYGLKKRLKQMVSGAKPASVARPPAAPDTAKSQPSSPGKPGLLNRILQRVLQPDPQVTWLPILTRAARRLVVERQIDLVLITAAPYSNVLLAERLRKRFPHLPIVLDFRDEWLATAFDPVAFQFGSSEAGRAFAVRAEAHAVASANAVVSVTRAAQVEIRARYPQQPEDKFLYLPNGFDRTRLPARTVTPAPRPDGRIVVTYVGSLYASTDPTTLIAAMRSLPAELQSRFLFRFIGQIEEARFRDALLALGAMVELKGFLPQHEALAAMSETDYALLITHDRLNISAKFYDYVGAGKPILACVHPEGDARRLLDELRAGWWADSSDVAALRQLFVDAAAHGGSPIPGFSPDNAAIAQFERKPLAQRYARLLHSIAGNKPAESTIPETMGARA